VRREVSQEGSQEGSTSVRKEGSLKVSWEGRKEEGRKERKKKVRIVDLF